MSVRVLLVEDNPVNRELVVDLLEVEGHEVTTAEDGASFREIVDSGYVPELVLMDILLPDTNGVLLFHELRARRSFDRIPVVALTAHALTRDVERLRDEGFAHVLTKPIDTREFVAMIELCASLPTILS